MVELVYISMYRPKQYAGVKLAGGISPDEFDAFHELILVGLDYRSHSH
jgi:hypothetical protein